MKHPIIKRIETAVCSCLVGLSLCGLVSAQTYPTPHYHGLLLDTPPTFTGMNGFLIGNPSAPIGVGTFSGNTTEVCTVSGALTSGHLVAVDSHGNCSDAGVATSSLGGSTGTYTAPGTGAVSRTLQSKLQGMEVSIADYGAVCNGTTDDTTSIQEAWNAGATLGLNVNLSGVGLTCRITSLTMPTPTQTTEGVLPPAVSMLIGDGPNSTTLLSSVTGSACAITVTVPYASYEPTGRMGGFTIKQSTTPNGNGICLNQVTKLEISQVFVYGFNDGIQAEDTINLHLHDSVFNGNVIAVYGGVTTDTRPNAWTVDNNIFSTSQHFAIELIHPDQVNILNNTFEANGTNLTLGPSTILIDGLAEDGNFGANIEGNYFEDDAAQAISIIQVSGDIATAFNISKNSFIRNSSNEAAMIFVSNAASAATNIITLTLFANGFLDTSPYTPGSLPYISLANPTVGSVSISCLGNIYTAQASMPAKCQVPSASATWSMDANGVYGGP